MDMDGDGKVDLSEFLEFMKEEGYKKMQNPAFFRELDFDGDGTLDFDEVMTAYYINKSGRPFCGECGNFIRGIFFSCVVCYTSPEASFDMCCDCYRSKKFDHKHDGRAQFLDNFALLEAMKDSSGPTTQANKRDQQNQTKSPVPASNSQATKCPPPASNSQATKSPVPAANSQATRSPILSTNTQAKSQVPSHTTTVPAANTTNVIYNTYVMNPSPPVSGYYNAVIHPPHRNQWRFALKTLEAALAIGGVASSLAMCTIM
ncbi:hypothetical protein F511_20854 [Dorcoceras hygrometricum]|uniref:EF-hand domain-containing protein n=1 Tax=Dorcoceras hygrometricum TaxID=472368 RepID=A0A2Z7CA07_9LAMI|nr:hypothetical protein F511_20854 [Dorcoceras hygrometricum]